MSGSSVDNSAKRQRCMHSIQRACSDYLYPRFDVTASYNLDELNKIITVCHRLIE
jgi:hypothetical protein